MRTIKFRAWDLDNQEMYYQSETKFNEVWTIDFNGIRFLEQRTIDSYPGGEYHEQKEEWVEPNQELMQFTGVKDLRGFLLGRWEDLILILISLKNIGIAVNQNGREN